jgi:hypothetical protein
MKTTLKLVALVIAVGFPIVTFAEFLGAPIPAFVNAEEALLAFSFAIGGLLLMRDYTSALPALKSDYRVRRSSAYGIRRNAEVSRLAA